MKIIKLISALLASSIIFGVSAFAADVKFDDTVAYTAGAETVTVNLYANSTMVNLDQYSCIELAYDNTVFSLKTATTLQEKSSAKHSDQNISITYSNDSGDIVVNTSVPLMTVEFNVLDATKVVGSKFTVDPDLSFMAGDACETIYDLSDVSVTVTAAGPAGPTVEEGETADNGITEYTVSTLENKKVMMSQKFEKVEIKPETRFVVTWNDKTRYFGSDLYDKLLNGGQSEGSIKIDSLTFGLIVDGDANVNDFTFAIK